MSADLVFKGLIGCTKNAFNNKNNKRFSLFGNPVYEECYNDFGAFLSLIILKLCIDKFYNLPHKPYKPVKNSSNLPLRIILSAKNVKPILLFLCRRSANIHAHLLIVEESSKEP